MHAVVVKLDKHDTESRAERIGVFTFVELPRIGDDLMIADDLDLNYFRVKGVVHYPIPHPFVRDEVLPSLQDTEPSVRIEVEWVGIE